MILQYLTHPKTRWDDLLMKFMCIFLMGVAIAGSVGTIKRMKRRRLDEICIEQPDF